MVKKLSYIYLMENYVDILKVHFPVVIKWKLMF